MLILTLLINMLLFVAAIVIHYETLYMMAKHFSQLRITPRYRVLIGVGIIAIAHVIEIWLFAFGYYFMLHTEGFGSLSGNINNSLLDCGYFSFTTYTTLGFGDIEPSGYIRFLTGFESLTGLILITWSASFLFIEMQRYWPKR